VGVTLWMFLLGILVLASNKVSRDLYVEMDDLRKNCLEGNEDPQSGLSSGDSSSCNFEMEPKLKAMKTWNVVLGFFGVFSAIPLVYLLFSLYFMLTQPSLSTTTAKARVTIKR
jgi:hypothetical protein